MEKLSLAAQTCGMPRRRVQPVQLRYTVVGLSSSSNLPSLVCDQRPGECKGVAELRRSEALLIYFSLPDQPEAH